MNAKVDKRKVQLSDTNRNYDRADFVRILEANNYACRPKKGKHGWLYRHSVYRDQIIQVPNHKTLPPDYPQELKRQLRIIESRDIEKETDDDE